MLGIPHLSSLALSFCRSAVACASLLFACVSLAWDAASSARSPSIVVVISRAAASDSRAKCSRATAASRAVALSETLGELHEEEATASTSAAAAAADNEECVALMRALAAACAAFSESRARCACETVGKGDGCNHNKRKRPDQLVSQGSASPTCSNTARSAGQGLILTQQYLLVICTFHVELQCELLDSARLGGATFRLSLERLHGTGSA